MNDELVLTDEQFSYAVSIGVKRMTEAIKLGCKHTAGFEGVGWTENIEGACGEYAAALFLDLEWEAPVNTFKVGGDVGELQVRTRTDHKHDLILRPGGRGDRPTDYFILVTGQAPKFRVRGGILASEGMVGKMRDFGFRAPAWFVPVERLTKLERGSKIPEGSLCNDEQTQREQGNIHDGNGVHTPVNG
jgi:hypothetical protein